MIERTYQCNFCRQEYDPRQGQLVGLHWEGSGGGTTFRYFGNTYQTEWHICIRCIKCLVNIAQTDLKGRL